MTATIIDGTAIADEMRVEIAEDTARFIAQYGYPPCARCRLGRR